MRFAIPPKRKNVVPNHFRQDSADPEPWGSIMRFENYMKARGVHKGNAAKLRPIRSSRWKNTYPGLVPVSHKWHDKEHVHLTRALSDDPSTIPEIYRVLALQSRAESRQRRKKEAQAPGKPWTAFAEEPDSDEEKKPAYDNDGPSAEGRRAGAFHGVGHLKRQATPDKMKHKRHLKEVDPDNEPEKPPLPPGFEEKVTENGRTYYINHNDQTTQWERPQMPPPRAKTPNSSRAGTPASSRRGPATPPSRPR